MSVNQFDLIVWDWDGTLADSTRMIANALVKAAEQANLPAIDTLKATSIIGLGLKEAVHALFGDLSAQKARELTTYYHANYYAGESHIPLFENAFETLATLKRRGYKMAVATGKGRRGLNSALNNTGLTKFFQATRTADECFSKPHPQMLDELMDDLVVMPERTIMIGDTSYDMQMAKNAGVHSAAVTYGAHTKEKLQSYQPEYLFERFDELSAWLLNE